MGISAAERVINERSTRIYRAFLADETGAAILVANINALTLTLYNLSDLTIINGRNDQNVLNANNVTYVSASISPTAFSNASPIVVSSVAHGRVTGDLVNITGVLGNIAANNTKENPLWTITKIGADSFSLDGSSGTGAYVSGGTLTYSLLEWQMQPADNVIVVATVVQNATEEHVALFKITWDSSKIAHHEWRPLVKNLGKVT